MRSAIVDKAHRVGDHLRSSLGQAPPDPRAMHLLVVLRSNQTRGREGARRLSQRQRRIGFGLELDFLVRVTPNCVEGQDESSRRSSSLGRRRQWSRHTVTSESCWVSKHPSRSRPPPKSPSRSSLGSHRCSPADRRCLRRLAAGGGRPMHPNWRTRIQTEADLLGWKVDLASSELPASYTVAVTMNCGEIAR
jgi:hypothetical protein